MEEDQHLTAYINQLNREQLALKDAADIIISEADKNRQFMTQIWKMSDLFCEKVMKHWTKKSPASRTWAHSVPYFKKENAVREKFEQARGQDRPTDGALAISDIEVRIEARMEAKYERMFQM